MPFLMESLRMVPVTIAHPPGFGKPRPTVALDRARPRP
jgi:hypothetical protein